MINSKIIDILKFQRQNEEKYFIFLKDEERKKLNKFN